MLLYTTHHNEMMKKWADFMEIEFHLNVNIECIFIIQLGLNVIELNWTQIHKLNWSILNVMKWNSKF